MDLREDHAREIRGDVEASCHAVRARRAGRSEAPAASSWPFFKLGAWFRRARPRRRQVSCQAYPVSSTPTLRRRALLTPRRARRRASIDRARSLRHDTRRETASLTATRFRPPPSRKRPNDRSRVDRPRHDRREQPEPAVLVPKTARRDVQGEGARGAFVESSSRASPRAVDGSSDRARALFFFFPSFVNLGTRANFIMRVLPRASSPHPTPPSPSPLRSRGSPCSRSAPTRRSPRTTAT